MRTEYKIRFIISTNVTKGSPEQLRNIFKTRRGCYVKRTGSEHESHLLSDGASGHDRSAGKSSESADIESDAEGGREYVQEYTPTDKTRKSKIRTCMYGA